jgi:pyruvyl transferase EpsO
MPLALVDFPNHPNVGDSAIWLGEAEWLRSNANVRRYVCDLDTYDPRALRARLPEGPILLHGGGNFGDLWPRHQRLREAVIRDFPDRPVIQLPQTLHFDNPAALDDAARLFNAHEHFTLMVRDDRSLELASRAFRATAVLCPDMAFCLALPPPPQQRPQGVVFLKRTDREAPVSLSSQVPADAVVVDWLDEWPSERWASRLYKLAAIRYPNRFAAIAPRVVDGIAARRLVRGVRLLSTGQRVITDRLHAHILCLLLGIPHTVIDNSYGKLSSFIETWTAGTCDVAW